MWRLADSQPCDAVIEMLIGNDYYFDLLEPRKRDLSGSLFLFHSKLRWVLGGELSNHLTRIMNLAYQ